MVYYVLYYYNSSLLQSTLLLTRYTCTNVFPTAENISGNLFSADVVQDLQRFAFSLRGHQYNVSLYSVLSYEGTGKSRMAQGRVNREDEQLISLMENKTSRTLFVLYYQPS